MALKELYDKSYLKYLSDTGSDRKDNYNNPEVFKGIKDYKSAYNKDQELTAFKITLFQRMSLIIGDNTSVHRMIADYFRNFILYTNIDSNSTSGKRSKDSIDSTDIDRIIELVENLIAVLEKEATLESILEALRKCLTEITDHTDSLAQAFITLARCVPSEKLKQDT